MGFNVFGKFIPWYGFFIAVGSIFAITLGLFLCKKKELDSNIFILICAYLFGFGFVGAKLLYILVSFKSLNFDYIFENSDHFNAFIGSGFVFYGGILGGLLGILFIIKIHSIVISEYLKTLSPCLSLLHAFGRIGCSFAGCCYGKETHGSFYFCYHHSIVAPNNIHLFPVQGIESFFLFILTGILIYLLFKKPELKVHYIYLLSYSLIRFGLEFMRGDIARGMFGIFSISQIISLGLLSCIIICFKEIF